MLTTRQIAGSATAHLLSEERPMSTRILLDVIRSTAAYRLGEAHLQTCVEVVQRLARLLADSDTNYEAQRSTHSNSPDRLESLLELALIHHKSFLLDPECGVHREALLLILSRLMAQSPQPIPASTVEFTFDVAAIFVDNLPSDTKENIRINLGEVASHPRLRFLFGFTERTNGWLYTTSDLADSVEFTLDARDDQVGKQPYVTRSWDMLGDSTPNIGSNDTAVSLSMFGGRRV
jgi:hypothetical protein